ncbi:XRE family transcriptional regulator [Aquabacterium sp. A7-Y]|uniref:helix-turn-helix domain-containing protein n=1 Tax=Aquabacterium sp. A7-Y TaxID=1349605 RepID=UPI00223CB392|nr:XRE family transcriptional regulator [Aquabacterium sp. A7-Y]MCW7541669.1 XRE family transcriptional regulator [Aquabacterium sp. A7-Y]
MKSRPSPVLPPDLPPVLRHVATNLRATRLARGLSQEALAGASGVSRRMLVGLENGDTNVSLTTLDRVAAALGVTFAELLRPPGESQKPQPVLAWRGAVPGSHALLLQSLPLPRGAVELWEFRLAPGDRYDAEPDPAGFHEMLYVTDGTLCLLEVSGRRVLHSGDSCLFPSDQAYAYCNESTTFTTFVRNVVAGPA